MLLLLLTMACSNNTGDDTDVTIVSDVDGDGWSIDEGDCDDDNAQINPDAVEVCDTVDNDCDGGVDVDASDETVWYRDADADTFGDPADTASACEAPSGYITDNTDCDDSLSAVFPGAPEVICNGVLEDCDGSDGDLLVPDDFATIQAAVDAVQDGGSICVAPGSYGAVSIAHPVMLASLEGATVTTLDGGGARTVVQVSAPDVTLRGFEVTGGWSADRGGGLYCDAAGLTLLDNLFSYNTSDQYGGAAFLNQCDGSVVEGNTFTFNEAPYGAAVNSASSEGLRIVDNVVEYNVALYAAAVFVAGGPVEVRGNDFEGNQAAAGAGLVYAAADEAVIAENTFIGHSVSQSGGALYGYSSRGVLLEDNVFQASEAVEYGGAVYLGLETDVTLSGNHIDGAYAGIAGGGLYVETSVGVTLSDNVVEHGESAGGGGAYINAGEAVTLRDNQWNLGLATAGGGVVAMGMVGLEISGDVFDGNEATSGAGLYLIQAEEVLLNDCTFSNNQAAETGGGLVVGYVTGLEMSGGGVTDNTVLAGYGGGMLLTGGEDMRISGVNFEGNVTQSSSTVKALGGGLMGGGIIGLELDGNSFVGNSSGQAGGGVYLTLVAPASLSDNAVSQNIAVEGAGLFLDECSLSADGDQITDNTATGSGGGVYVDTSTVDLYDATIEGNTPDNVVCQASTGCTPS